MGQLSIISGLSCVSRLQVTSLPRLLMSLLWCEQITNLLRTLLWCDHITSISRTLQCEDKVYMCVWKISPIYILNDVSMYLCMFLCKCIHICKYMYVCMHVNKNKCKYIYI